MTYPTLPYLSLQLNYFFRLSRYQKEIEELLSSDDFVQPVARRNEVRARGLQTLLPPEEFTPSF